MDGKRHIGAGSTRREVTTGVLKTAIVANVMPTVAAQGARTQSPLRTVNVMNFIRAEEPRETMDLMLPVREQMTLIKAHGFPATWLLQYDAMVEGPFVGFLKEQMTPEHETGIWLEMNRKLCDDAGVAWRGRADWEWDYHVPVAYLIGYTPAERIKLADTAMATHKRVFGRDAKTVACWNLDAVTLAHLADRYGIDAFANCRDQIATDGYTIWGAPITAYYPNRRNALSPARSAENQINTPMFRLLGQDPVYYYDNTMAEPDTMEPVWAAGQSATFVDRFLGMTAHSPTQAIAYAQLGQENSFGWPMMRTAYPMQMAKLAKIRRDEGLTVETMGETGRRFKRRFIMTPTQAQVMLEDPFAKADMPERTIWYQSKYYRANLHCRGNEFFLRDLHVYADGFEEPYLKSTVREHGIEQRMLAALDAYHWSDPKTQRIAPSSRAMGAFTVTDSDGTTTRLTMAGVPVVTESETTLTARMPLTGGGTLIVEFGEADIAFSLRDVAIRSRLGLAFTWAAERSTFRNTTRTSVNYSYRGFDYSVRILDGTAEKAARGVEILADGPNEFCLLMKQALT